MALSFTKLSKCFLYIFVFINHVLNLSEPLAKQKDARSKNGVVCKTGRTTPIAPNANYINPTDI